MVLNTIHGGASDARETCECEGGEGALHRNNAHCMLLTGASLPLNHALVCYALERLLLWQLVHLKRLNIYPPGGRWCTFARSP